MIHIWYVLIVVVFSNVTFRYVSATWWKNILYVLVYQPSNIDFCKEHFYDLIIY